MDYVDTWYKKDAQVALRKLDTISVKYTSRVWAKSNASQKSVKERHGHAL